MCHSAHVEIRISCFVLGSSATWTQHAARSAKKVFVEMLRHRRFAPCCPWQGFFFSFDALRLCCLVASVDRLFTPLRDSPQPSVPPTRRWRSAASALCSQFPRCIQRQGRSFFSGFATVTEALPLSFFLKGSVHKQRATAVFWRSFWSILRFRVTCFAFWQCSRAEF